MKFEHFIENEIELYKENLLEQFSFDLCHALEYSWPTIERHFIDSLIDQDILPMSCKNISIPSEVKEKIIDYLIEFEDELLCINTGYHLITNHISLGNIDEIEIDISHLNITEKRKEIINQYTDLYIPDWFNPNFYELGYVSYQGHIDIIIDAKHIFECIALDFAIDKFDK